MAGSEIAKEILALGHTVIKRARLSNAMGVPLVLVAIVTVPCLAIYAITKFWPILILGALPVLYFLYAFDYLMKHNPNMLRTEEHEERMLQISVGMGRKGKELSEQDIEQLPAVTPAEAKKTLNKPKGGDE